jgi:hypothetical protein
VLAALALLGAAGRAHAEELELEPEMVWGIATGELAVGAALTVYFAAPVSADAQGAYLAATSLGGVGIAVGIGLLAHLGDWSPIPARMTHLAIWTGLPAFALASLAQDVVNDVSIGLGIGFGLAGALAGLLFDSPGEDALSMLAPVVMMVSTALAAIIALFALPLVSGDLGLGLASLPPTLTGVATLVAITIAASDVVGPVQVQATSSGLRLTF